MPSWDDPSNNRHIPQVPLEQQRQRDFPYFSTPQTLREPEPVQAQLGQPPNKTFVVSNFDARPINGYDGFYVLRNDGNTALAADDPGDGYIVPQGYTAIIRHINIMFNIATLAGGPFIFDLWGNPQAGIYFEYQVLLNGQPAPQVSPDNENFHTFAPTAFRGVCPVIYAAMSPIDVETYIIAPEHTVVQTITRFDRANNTTAWSGGWATYSTMSINILQNTGVVTPEEPVNKTPIPVQNIPLVGVGP